MKCLQIDYSDILRLPNENWKWCQWICKCFHSNFQFYANPWYSPRYSIHPKRTEDETRRIKERFCSFYAGWKQYLFLLCCCFTRQLKSCKRETFFENGTEVSTSELSRRECDASHVCDAYEISVYSKRKSKWTCLRLWKGKDDKIGKKMAY